MSNDGTGKIKQKKVQFGGKPYERSEPKPRDDISFLGKVKETVKNLLVPSWFAAKSSNTNEQTNVSSGALLEQLTAPPLNAGEDIYYNPAKKPPPKPGAETAPHPYQIPTHRFVSPAPPSFAESRPPQVPYMTHLGGQSIGNSVDPFPARSEFPPPSIRVSPPTQEANVVTHDVPDSPELATENRSDVSESSFIKTKPIGPNLSGPMFRSRLSLAETTVPGPSRPKAAVSTPATNPTGTESSRNTSTTAAMTPGATKPSFNVSLFANSRLIHDQTSSILGIDPSQSPYYPGKTIYGGASAHRKSRLTPGQPYSRNVGIRKMAAKTSPNNPAGAVTSSTTRRILDALDSMSSVLSDARKVPLNTSSLMDTSASYTSRSYRRLENRSLVSGGAPPIKRHCMPSPVSVTENRQSSLLRETAIVSRERKSPSSVVYPELSSQTPVAPRSGKMRRDRGTRHYKSVRDEDEDVVNHLDLKSSFRLPVPSSFNLSTFAVKPSVEKSPVLPTSAGGNGSTPFRFASPMASIPPIGGTTSLVNQEFQFSSPVAVTADETKSESVLAAPASVVSGRPPLSNKFVASVSDNKSGSAVVTNGPPSTFPPSSSSAKKIGASENVKSGADSAKNTTLSDLAAKFKPPEGSWECPECMINNNADSAQCAACCTRKPEPKPAGWTCSKCRGSNVETASSCAKCGCSRTSITVKNDQKLAEKFKPASGSWECPMCWISNSGDADKCIACSASNPRPSKANESLKKKFEKPQGSWECDTCLVVNESRATKCIACETANPNSSSSSEFSKASSYQFGTSDSGGFKCSMTSANNGFTFGGKKVESSSKLDAPTVGFSFGGKKADSSDLKSDAPSVGFSFGSKKADSSAPKSDAPSVGFQFGAPSSGVKLGASDSGLSFGGNKDGKIGFTFGAKNAQLDESKNSGFSFQKSGEKSSSSSAPQSTVTNDSTGNPSDSISKLSDSNKAKELTSKSIFSPPNSDALPSTGDIVSIFKHAPINHEAKKDAPTSAVKPMMNFGSSSSAAPAPSFLMKSPPASSSNAQDDADDESGGKKRKNVDSGLFSFGPPKPTMTTTSTVAGAVAPVATSTTATSGFSFSFGAKKPEEAAKGDVSGAPTFGAPPLATPAAPAFKATGFGSSFGGAGFGQPTTNDSAKTSSPFGSASASSFSFSAPGTSVVGSSSSQEAGKPNPPAYNAPSKAPSFGGSTSAPFGAATEASVFGATKNPPSFGSTSNAPAFGSTSNAPKFGAPTNPPAFGAPTNVPTFGAATTAPTFGGGPTNASVFGSSGNPPAFGAPTNSMTSTTAPKPAPTPFGGSNASGGFTFNAGAPVKPASSGGFNFTGVPTTPGQVFQFGGSSGTPAPAAPSFNFTGGTASSAPSSQQPFIFGGSQPTASANPFSASAKPSAVAGRKIKKVIRRNASNQNR